MRVAGKALLQACGGVAAGALLCLLALTILLAPATASAGPHTARDYKMAGDATHMRIVVQFDAEPEMRWLLLRGPHRLVIDLPNTRFAFIPKDLKAKGLVKEVRYGGLGQGGSRLIVSTKGPFTVEDAKVVANEEGGGYRLVLEIAAASSEAFNSALADQAQTTGSTAAPKGDRLKSSSATKPFVIVIDPGHGGIDGGAEGVGGTVEKDVTLTFARELRDTLMVGGRYQVFMTREDDSFLRLDDRVRIARQHGADLFISVHADTIRLKGVRGATVYTVAEKASDAEAQALADRENLSDQLGGMVVEDPNHQVADILVDLIRRETHGFSIRFARALVGELSTSVDLINNPHRYAGFKVLKAPDVPSVLVELGYLSNEKDEAQLMNAEWRGKAVASISSAVAAFAASRAAGG